jgi:hypothetical protein
MPLEPVPLALDGRRVPADVRRFLRVAERRIERFRRDRHVARFVPSDFVSAYAALRTVEETDLVPGRALCEWGSGFAVVACLAAMLGFDASGIEIDADLVEEAQQLADDFEVPVGLVCGSFFPEGEEAVIVDGAHAWLASGASGYEELGLGPEDFDVIYAYPWPDEQRVVADLFECHAREGALLLTNHGGGDFLLRRKTARRPRS